MADDNKIIGEIRDRFKEAHDATEEQYRICVDDLKMLDGQNHWPADVLNDRGADRPSLTINKLPTFADQVSGDIRQNTPTIKVKPVDSDADPETAEVFTGIIRNIEVQSNGDIAYDTAGEGAVNCGIGAFRIITDYTDDDTFDQDIFLKRIKNPFTIYWDPSAQEFDKSDAQYCFITEKLSRDEFIRKYPDASLQEFDANRDKETYWGDAKNIRVCEYFVKKRTKKTLYLLEDPESGEQYVRDEQVEGYEVVNKRDVETHEITWYKTNGHEILEGPTEFPSRYIPIIMVYGKELTIENNTIYRGVVRHAKDPQRLYNYSRSTNAETVSLAPKAPYIVTAKQIKNYQTMWDTAHKKNWPYLPYDQDGQALPPTRQAPIQQNTGLLTEIQISDQEMHDTTGLQLSNMGKQSNEKSGRAILARERQGDTANFAYYDNLGRALKYAGKVLVDMIPRIWDTPRIARLLGEGDEEKFVPVNQSFMEDQPDGSKIERIYDLTVGKYDVMVTIGPSYNTQREEASDGMTRFIEAVPQAGPLLGDLIAKYQDWPGAQEIERRMKFLLPPGLVQEEGGPGQGGNGQGQPQMPQEPEGPSNEEVIARTKAEKEIVDLNIAKEKLKGQQIETRTKEVELQQKMQGEASQ